MEEEYVSVSSIHFPLVLPPFPVLSSMSEGGLGLSIKSSPQPKSNASSSSSSNTSWADAAAAVRMFPRKYPFFFVSLFPPGLLSLPSNGVTDAPVAADGRIKLRREHGSDFQNCIFVTKSQPPSPSRIR